MPGFRVECAYCKTSVLSRDIGLHIMRHHRDSVFSLETKEGTDNRRSSLWRDKYLTEPLPLDIGRDQEVYFCLADNTCFRCLTKAEMHMKTRKEKHKEALEALREKYPKDTPRPENEAGVGVSVEVGLTSKKRQKLQDWMAFLWSEHKDITFSNAERKIFDELGIKTKLEDLKELYPDHFAEEKEEEEEEEEPPEEQPPEEPLPDLFAAPEEEETEATPLPIPEPVVEQPPPPPPMMPKPVIPPKHLLYHNFTVKPPEPTFPKLIQNTKQMKG